MTKKKKKPLYLYIIGTRKLVDKMEDLGKDPKNPAYIIATKIENLEEAVRYPDALRLAWQKWTIKIANRLYPKIQEKILQELKNQCLKSQ